MDEFEERISRLEAMMAQFRPPETEERKMLRELAIQLEKWADESRIGGWSTRQVGPMIEKAREIYVFLGKGIKK